MSLDVEGQCETMIPLQGGLNQGQLDLVEEVLRGFFSSELEN